MLKCRPPGNRNPEPAEIETCTPFLREQIRVIEPEVLVTLGNFSTKFVLRTEVGITRLHGRAQQAGPIHGAADLPPGRRHLRPHQA